MPDTYHHHEPAGVCGVCDEFTFAHATFWLPAADIMAQVAHWQTCEVARSRLAQAHAQLEAKQESGEYRGLAQSWMQPEAIPVTVAVEIPTLVQEVVT